MTTRNLSQRLKRLVLPTGEPMVMRIVFVDRELRETGSHLAIGTHVQNQSPQSCLASHVRSSYSMGCRKLGRFSRRYQHLNRRSQRTP